MTDLVSEAKYASPAKLRQNALSLGLHRNKVKVINFLKFISLKSKYQVRNLWAIMDSDLNFSGHIRSTAAAFYPLKAMPKSKYTV